MATLKTDDFGDFWFERQEPGIYSLKIEMKGYAPKTIEAIDATKDVNVGEIELKQTTLLRRGRREQGTL